MDISIKPEKVEMEKKKVIVSIFWYRVIGTYKITGFSNHINL